MVTAAPTLVRTHRSGVVPSTLRAARRVRGVPLLFAALIVIVGMAYTLFWEPVLHHSSLWMTPHDFWATYRDAHYVGWWDLGGIYSNGTGLVTFPGIAVLLAPVAMLTGAFGMTEAFPLVVPHPTAWLIAGPFMIAVASAALFGADAVCRRMRMSLSRRLVASFFVSIGLFNTVVVFGHPEDAIAVGFSCYALVAALDRRPVATGWMFGLAIAFQPLVIVIVPLVIAVMGMKSCWRVTWRSLAPSAGLLIAPVLSTFHDSVQALVEQPNFPNIDHRTPLTFLAPTVGGSGRSLQVAAGPLRSLSVVGAVLIAIWLRRKLSDPAVLVWAASAVLALRCLAESVMDAYYIWPAMALACLVLARKKAGISAFAFSLVAFVTVFSDIRFGEWLWWPVTVGTLLGVVIMAAPPLKSGPVDDDHIEVVPEVSRTASESLVTSSS